MIRDYAQVLSPCCDVVLHRPHTGRDSGKFFCQDCGQAYLVQTFEGQSSITKDCGHLDANGQCTDMSCPNF